MAVADHMTAPIGVNPFDTLAEARTLMEAKGFRHLTVTVTTTDLLKALLQLIEGQPR
jgi:CBS domain-containing protein